MLWIVNSVRDVIVKYHLQVLPIQAESKSSAAGNNIFPFICFGFITRLNE